MKCKDKAGEPLHYHSEYKCDGNRKEYGQNDSKRLVGIDQAGIRQRRVVHYLHQSQRRTSA